MPRLLFKERLHQIPLNSGPYTPGTLFATQLAVTMAA